MKKRPGTPRPRVLSLNCGKLDARLEDNALGGSGFHGPLRGSGQVTSLRIAQERPDYVRRFLRGWSRGLATLITNPTVALPIAAKYLNSDDSDLLGRADLERPGLQDFVDGCFDHAVAMPPPQVKLAFVSVPIGIRESPVAFGSVVLAIARIVPRLANPLFSRPLTGQGVCAAPLCRLLPDCGGVHPFRSCRHRVC